MGKITFTLEQIKEILAKIASQKDAFQRLLKLSLEALMKAEREEIKQEHNDNVNGFSKRIIGAGDKFLLNFFNFNFRSVLHTK